MFFYGLNTCNKIEGGILCLRHIASLFFLKYCIKGESYRYFKISKTNMVYGYNGYVTLHWFENILEKTNKRPQK